MKKYYDVVFVGGGLANGLAAYRLSQVRPDVEFLILEAGDSFGGNHTWSFHESDLDPLDFTWIEPFIAKSWDGTDVIFPSYARTVSGRYHTVLSATFHERLKSTFHYQLGLGKSVREVFPDMVVLKDGFKVHAGCVVDGRGWDGAGKGRVGYQKFVGIELALKAPHGLARPRIMDATHAQIDGYRFFYSLPWTDRTVLVEDTRYSDDADIDEAAYRREILAYAVRQGWEISEIGRVEVGCLPIPLNGRVPEGDPGVVLSGTRAGLFHATTGYSLPDAVRFASDFSGRGNFHGPDVFEWSRERNLRHWKGQWFYRLLNRLMFQAARPENRYRILESFYRRPDDLIARFYAGKSTGLDRARMFTGTPPVPIFSALRQVIASTKIA